MVFRLDGNTPSMIFRLLLEGSNLICPQSMLIHTEVERQEISLQDMISGCFDFTPSSPYHVSI